MNALRKGMWVRHVDKVGIIAGFTTIEQQDGLVAGAEVHFVDDKGFTQTRGFVALTSLTQAAFDDIPKARRPSQKTARLLGYWRI